MTYLCDRCGRPANAITILPGLHRPPTLARVTCWPHAPRRGNAYGFELGRWFDDGPDLNDPSRRYSIRRHLLAVKIHGAQAVALDSRGSPEADTVAVNRYYQRCLHRAADDSGQAAFTDSLQQGVPNNSIIAVLVGSQEYFDRAQ